ncbi:hypothetical protein QEN19_001460 [Hanseniaspora menglaensis]
MVFTRSGHSKRGNHGSSASNNNLKNVPKFKTITDYIIQRNVVENEEFKIWKDNWSVMFDYISTLKPLEFNAYEGNDALEKYESEVYKDVVIAASATDNSCLYYNLSDDAYIYRIKLDFEKISKGELDYWKLDKIGYCSGTSKLLQMEMLTDNRLLVLTSTQLQLYDLANLSETESLNLIEQLKFSDYEQINRNHFGFLKLTNNGQNKASPLEFSIIENNKILLSNGKLINIEQTSFKSQYNVCFSESDTNEAPLILKTFGNQMFYTFDKRVIHENSLDKTSSSTVILDINKWNESIAEYEEDKVEDITSLIVCKFNKNLLLTSHIDGEINLWDISKTPVTEKFNKILKLKHSSIQNRELLVDRSLKKNFFYENNSKANDFKKYDYSIVENYLTPKRLNGLDENGVEWVHPYINKLEWINEYEFWSHCSRSGFIYHWNILGFIEHDMKMIQAVEEKQSEIKTLTTEECEQICLQFKHTSGGQRRGRSPKYLKEFNIEYRMQNSTAYLNEKKKIFVTANGDGTILLYKLRE